RRRPGEAVHRLPAPEALARRAGLGADRDRARLRLSLRCAVLAVFLQELVHPRGELRGREGLADVRVGACGEAAANIRLLRLRGQQEQPRGAELRVGAYL